jgi:hypothetical protein
MTTFSKVPEAGRCHIYTEVRRPHHCPRGVVAFNYDEVNVTYKVYANQALHAYHQVYIDIHTNIIFDIFLAPAGRSYTPPTCLSPMKKTTTCFADDAKAIRQVIMSDTDKADNTRPDTDEAKAVHIFIIEHR